MTTTTSNSSGPTHLVEIPAGESIMDLVREMSMRIQIMDACKAGDLKEVHRLENKLKEMRRG